MQYRSPNADYRMSIIGYRISITEHGLQVQVNKYFTRRVCNKRFYRYSGCESRCIHIVFATHVSTFAQDVPPPLQASHIDNEELEDSITLVEDSIKALASVQL